MHSVGACSSTISDGSHFVNWNISVIASANELFAHFMFIENFLILVLVSVMLLLFPFQLELSPANLARLKDF